MSARPEERRSPASPWVCHSNYITCFPYGDGKQHLLRYYKTGYQADLRRVSGHAFLECRQCHPSMYIFAVLSTNPSPIATCYAISKDSYDEWEKDPGGETYSTPEMLYRLRAPDGRSLNPHWRPQG